MKPILFNTEMVRAILDGRKRHTRRVAKTIQEDREHSNIRIGEIVDSGGIKFRQRFDFTYDGNVQKNLVHDGLKTKYQVGDILWVKETFLQEINSTLMPCGEYESYWCSKIEFVADGAKERFLDKEAYSSGFMRKRPSIHMPKKHARIFLRVTNVRVERLQDINEDDCLKEGMPIEEKGLDVFLLWWMPLWNSTAKEGYKWEDNPYVFVYEFEKVEKPCETKS